MYLFDTNIISEVVKSKPDPKVSKWLSSIDYRHAYLSVLTLGEIRKGVEKSKDPIKKRIILEWLEGDLLMSFNQRIIPIDAEVADKWGYLQSCRNIPVIDCLLAASALVHNLKFVTRNVKDFEMIGGLEIINPFST